MTADTIIAPGVVWITLEDWAENGNAAQSTPMTPAQAREFALAIIEASFEAERACMK